MDQYALRSWDTSTGLPQNSIQDIVQQADGALWIATQEGLVYFDGFGFSTYNRANTASIRSNDISSVAFDAAGRLWAGTFSGGLICRENGRFETWTTADGLPSNSILDLCADARGKGVWAATRDHGLFFFDGEDLQLLGSADGLPSERTACVLCEPDGTLWVGTAAGLYRRSGDRGTVFDVSDGLTDADITALARDPEGDLWIVIRIDAHSTVWVGTTVGLNRLDPDRAIATLKAAQGLSADMVASLLVGQGQILWIGTHGGGLNMIRDPRITGFTNVHGLTNDIIYTVAPSPGGGFWAGSFAGDLDRYHNGAFENVLPRRSLGSTRIRTILEDSGGDLWIGTDVELCRWSRGRLSHCTFDGQPPPAPIRTLYQDENGTVLVGTDGAGVFTIDGTRLLPCYSTPDLRSGSVRAILRDGAGRLWIGTYGGLTLVDEEGCHTYTSRNGLPSQQAEYIRSLTATADGTLWIGTYGGGLLRFREDSFIACTSADGLPSDGLYQVIDDRRGGLWMTSNVGLCRISLDELNRFAQGRIDRITPITFTESDGMPNRECNGGSPGGLITTDGRLWFPTLGGLAMVDPTGLENPAPAPPAILEQVTVDERTIDDSASRILAANPQRVEFRFSAVNFLDPERTLFRYRLEGFETGWIISRSQQIAQYTHLAPGEYRFLLEASRDGATWSNEAAVWSFRIRPAFYETLLFYLLGAIAIAGGVRVVIHRRLRTIQRNERILQERVDEALAQVSTLRGMLPICSRCKKVRDDDGYWNQIETYVHEHSEAEFSHGLCPDCLKELYPEFADRIMAGPTPDIGGKEGETGTEGEK